MSNITVRVIEERCGRDYVVEEYRAVGGNSIVHRFENPVPKEEFYTLLPTISVAPRRPGARRNYLFDVWLRERYSAGATWSEMEEEVKLRFPELRLNREALRARVRRAPWYPELSKQREAEQPTPPTPRAANSSTPTTLVDRITGCLRRHGPSSSEQLAEWTAVSQAKVERNLQNNTDHFRLLPGNLWTLWD